MSSESWEFFFHPLAESDVNVFVNPVPMTQPFRKIEGHQWTWQQKNLSTCKSLNHQ